MDGRITGVCEEVGRINGGEWAIEREQNRNWSCSEGGMTGGR